MCLRTLVTIAVGAVLATAGAVVYGHSQNPSQSVAVAVRYLDHLRSCTAYTYNYPEPLAHSIAESTIRGRNGDACQVRFAVPNSYTAECAFSEAALRALTSQAKYRQARMGNFNASLSEAEGKRFGSECHFLYFPGPASSPSQVSKP
ncbi:MAG TPA: hypothetical protein VFA89_18925 [Terriglobales bacterium]|nr:hypothetical protein [Terriglobales bacterium]